MATVATRLAEPTAVEPARGMRLLGAAVVAQVVEATREADDDAVQ